MSYLIKINESTNEILRPDAVTLFPGFKKLKEDEILFIVLAYDYDSPFAQFTEEDRLRRASLHVWNDDTGGKILERIDIKFAINAYKGLQYNPKIDLTRTYQKKINDLELSMESITDGGLIDKTLKAINTLRAAIRDLEKETLQMYIEEGKLIGGGQRSFLEKMQKDKALYDSVTKKKVQ